MFPIKNSLVLKQPNPPLKKLRVLEKSCLAERPEQGGKEVPVPARRLRAAQELPETPIPESVEEELCRGAGNREGSSAPAENRQRGRRRQVGAGEKVGTILCRYFLDLLEIILKFKLIDIEPCRLA